MRCPSCDAPYDQLRVVLTTYTKQKETVRRRCCLRCEHRWYTLQHPEKVLDSDAVTWTRRRVVNVV